VTREPELALVFSPEMWVEELHRHCTDHGGARVRQLVLDPQLALDERFDVLIVSHRWPALTAPFVESLHATGRLVLGVFDRTEPAGEEHLIRLRVDATLESDAGPAEFLRVVDHLVGESAGPVVVEIGAADVPVTMDERVGQVVVVSGPSVRVPARSRSVWWRARAAPRAYWSTPTMWRREPRNA
jgi:hypothetical protein